MSCAEPLLAEHISSCACDLQQKRRSEEDGDALKVTCHVGLQLVGRVDRDFANLAPYISCGLSPELSPLKDRECEMFGKERAFENTQS